MLGKWRPWWNNFFRPGTGILWFGQIDDLLSSQPAHQFQQLDPRCLLDVSNGFARLEDFLLSRRARAPLPGHFLSQQRQQD